MLLTKEELLDINGGAISWTLFSSIAGAIIFLVGVVDGYLRPLKCRWSTMLNKEELLEIVGGTSISGTLINAFVRAINVALDVGRSLGSAIRRVMSKSMCSL